MQINKITLIRKIKIATDIFFKILKANELSYKTGLKEVSSDDNCRMFKLEQDKITVKLNGGAEEILLEGNPKQELLKLIKDLESPNNWDVDFINKGEVKIEISGNTRNWSILGRSAV